MFLNFTQKNFYIAIKNYVKHLKKRLFLKHYEPLSPSLAKESVSIILLKIMSTNKKTHSLKTLIFKLSPLILYTHLPQKNDNRKCQAETAVSLCRLLLPRCQVLEFLNFFLTSIDES